MRFQTLAGKMTRMLIQLRADYDVSVKRTESIGTQIVSLERFINEAGEGDVEKLVKEATHERKKRQPLSPEQRARMSEVMKSRWRKLKAADRRAKKGKE